MEPLIDKYQRRVNYLRISLTDRCNLRCLYCMPQEGIPKLPHEEILRYEELLRLVRVAVSLGIEKVRLTGGEPLLRRGLGGFIRALSACGLRDISITTNGTLLAECARDLKAAGLSRLNISLDTLRQGRFQEITGRPLLGDVLFGIGEAERAGFAPIKINVVAMAGLNDDEIADFGRLSIEKPYRIRFIELMPIGQQAGWRPERYLSGEEIKARLKPLGRLYALGSRKSFDGPAKRYRFKGALGEIGFINPISRHFCPACNRLRLTADGRLRACLFSDHETDIKRALRSGLSDDELRAVFRQAIANKPKRHPDILPGGPIRKCQRQMSQIGG
jgi:cyclic pyranopterin phosphate synthase